MTSERKHEEWKGKLTWEIGKQKARHVFGSLSAMTGEYISFESTRARARASACECVYARLWRHTRVNERVSISSDSYYGVGNDDGESLRSTSGFTFVGSTLDF